MINVRNITSFTGYWLVTDVSMQRRRVEWRLQRLA